MSWMLCRLVNPFFKVYPTCCQRSLGGVPVFYHLMFEAYLLLDPARSLVSTGACYTSGSCKYLLTGWQLLRRVRTPVLNFA